MFDERKGNAGGSDHGVGLFQKKNFMQTLELYKPATKFRHWLNAISIYITGRYRKVRAKPKSSWECRTLFNLPNKQNMVRHTSHNPT